MVNAERDFYNRDDRNYRLLIQKILPLCGNIIGYADMHNFYTEMTDRELAEEIIEMMEDINGIQRG